MPVLDGYLRVSRVGGRSGDSFISPTVQRDAIQRYADTQGIEIAAWHEDLDQSGAKTSRPAFDRMMRRVESGETNGVIVAKLDRFGRSLLGTLEGMKRLEEAGAKFVSTADQFDSTTSTGRLTMNVLLAIAQFELDRVRDNWSIAQGRAVERGVHISSAVPTGYTRGPDRRLIPHPEYGPVITELFARRAAGASWREACQLLEDRGVEGPYQAKQWTQRAVSHIIPNRVYLGEARSGQYTNPDAHEPLTDRATWEAAQAVRGTSSPRSEEGTVLAGLLRCAGCRHLMKPDSVTDRDGTRLRMYRCRGNHASGTCPDRAAILERVVLPHFEARLFEVVQGHERIEGESPEDDLAQAQRELEEAEADLAVFRDEERVVAVLGTDRFVEGLEARVARVEEAASRVALLRGSGLGTDSTTLRREWPTMINSQKRRLLASVFDAIMVRSGRSLAPEDRIQFISHGELPEDFPRRGHRVPLAPWPWPKVS